MRDLGTVIQGDLSALEEEDGDLAQVEVDEMPVTVEFVKVTPTIPIHCKYVYSNFFAESLN